MNTAATTLVRDIHGMAIKVGDDLVPHNSLVCAGTRVRLRVVVSVTSDHLRLNS